MTQFAFMRSPGAEHDFEVGDTVEMTWPVAAGHFIAE